MSCLLNQIPNSNFSISNCLPTKTARKKFMVRAHKQAWVWQDEWFGLTMDDIREIERETQRVLEQKMKKPRGSISEEAGKRKSKRRSSSVKDTGK